MLQKINLWPLDIVNMKVLLSIQWVIFQISSSGQCVHHWTVWLRVINLCGLRLKSKHEHCSENNYQSYDLLECVCECVCAVFYAGSPVGIFDFLCLFSWSIVCADCHGNVRMWYYYPTRQNGRPSPSELYSFQSFPSRLSTPFPTTSPNPKAGNTFIVTFFANIKTNWMFL